MQTRPGQARGVETSVSGVAPLRRQHDAACDLARAVRKPSADDCLRVITHVEIRRIDQVAAGFDERVHHAERVLGRREHGPPKIGRIFRMSATDILADILRLPTEERARLAHELIRSLDGEQEAGAAQAWDAEIERRGAEVDRGVANTMTFDEYRAHIRQRRAARPNR